MAISSIAVSTIYVRINIVYLEIFHVKLLPHVSHCIAGDSHVRAAPFLGMTSLKMSGKLWYNTLTKERFFL